MADSAEAIGNTKSILNGVQHFRQQGEINGGRHEWRQQEIEFIERQKLLNFSVPVKNVRTRLVYRRFCLGHMADVPGSRTQEICRVVLAAAEPGVRARNRISKGLQDVAMTT